MAGDVEGWRKVNRVVRITILDLTSYARREAREAGTPTFPAQLFEAPAHLFGTTAILLRPFATSVFLKSSDLLLHGSQPRL